MKYYTEFEVKFYGCGEEICLQRGQTQAAILCEVFNLPKIYPMLKEGTVTWSYAPDGIAIQIDGGHIGNVKPVYPTPEKIEHLHKVFAD